MSHFHPKTGMQSCFFFISATLFILLSSQLAFSRMAPTSFADLVEDQKNTVVNIYTTQKVQTGQRPQFNTPPSFFDQFFGGPVHFRHLQPGGGRRVILHETVVVERRAVHREHHGDGVGGYRPCTAILGRRARALRNPRPVLHDGGREDHGLDRAEHPSA